MKTSLEELQLALRQKVTFSQLTDMLMRDPRTVVAGQCIYLDIGSTRILRFKGAIFFQHRGQMMFKAGLCSIDDMVVFIDIDGASAFIDGYYQEWRKDNAD